MPHGSDRDGRAEQNILSHIDHAVIHKVAVEIHISSFAEDDMPAITEIERWLAPCLAATLMQHILLDTKAFFQLVWCRLIESDHPLFCVGTLLRQALAHIREELTVHDPIVHSHLILILRA